jgi:serine/threonine protein kinase
MSEPQAPDSNKTDGLDAPAVLQVSPVLPAHIGRYRIEKILGQGAFGTVYLAHDDELRRPVAIKVPNRERVSSPAEAEEYLAEARVVARLDHSHIVPVFDVGRTEDGLCFVVSKLIEGRDLAQQIKSARPSPECGPDGYRCGCLAPCPPKGIGSP